MPEPFLVGVGKVVVCFIGLVIFGMIVRFLRFLSIAVCGGGDIDIGACPVLILL